MDKLTLMRFYFKLCLILCLLAQNLVAQNRYLEWIDDQTALRKKIDIDAGLLHTEQANGTWLSENGKRLRAESSCNLPSQIESNSFSINKGKSLWFTINGLQRVYQYTPTTKTLTRIDKTIHQGYNYQSSQFMRNDALYSIGGYGFWHYNNTITYFDKELAEWTLLKAKGVRPSSIVEGYRGYHQTTDVFYTAGSMEVDSDYKNERTYTDDVHRFVFKTLTWEYLGKLNPKLPKQQDFKIKWTGKYFMFWTIEKIYIIDPEQNLAYALNNKIQHFEPDSKLYVKNDTLYCYWKKQPKIDKFSMPKLLKEAKVIGPFYLNPTPWLYCVAIALGIILSLLGIFLFFFNKRTKRQESASVFNELEEKLITAFLKLNPTDYLNVNEINHILSISQRSQETQRKIRIKTIKDMNNKIAVHYKIEEGIIRKDAADDKRLKLYALHPELYKLLKNE